MIHYFSLRSKIVYIFSAMAGIALAGGIGLLWYSWEIDKMLVTMVEKEVVLYKAAQDMELALANQKGFLTYYFVDGQAKWLKSLGQYREVFRQSLNRASSLNLNGEQQKTLGLISAEYANYVRAKDDVIENYSRGAVKDHISLLHEKQRGVFFNLLDLCRRFSLDQWNVIRETEAKNHARSNILRTVAFGAIAVFMGLSGLLLFVLYRQILIPIRGLAIETGGSPQESSRDEVLSLSQSLKGMMKDFDDTHDALTRSRQHLIQAERMAMVGEMAAGVAHTIRNPFTSIKMRMFSLSRSLDLTDVQNEDLQVIADEIGRIDKIVQNFLEFARPPKLRLTRCSIRNVIGSVITLLEYRLKEYNVALEYDADPGLPEIMADSDRIKEALVNLITNACEAMETGGKIIITETRAVEPGTGEVAVLSIADNGPGIADTLVHKITNPFFTTKEEGSGLGLSIVARIVREHDGAFSVSSDRKQGAEFIIKLPVKELAHGADTDH